jgi:hypothetical protein
MRVDKMSKQIKIVKLFSAPIILLLMTGCASFENYDLPDYEVGDGPGLFTGEEGRYEIDLD